MAGGEVEMTADMAVLLVVWMGTGFGAGTRSFCSSSDPGLEFPINVPLFHSTGEGMGSPKAGQKAGQSGWYPNASRSSGGSDDVLRKIFHSGALNPFQCDGMLGVVPLRYTDAVSRNSRTMGLISSGRVSGAICPPSAMKRNDQ
jgi:hypothetical protein